MTTAELTISLIVNTTDRAASLLTLLRALEHQSYSAFEVIAVVGPTRDNTLEVLSAYNGRVRILRCPQANLSQSRNIGLQAARGDVVAYIDDDAVPCQRWLEQLARLFQDPELTATGGIVYNVHPLQPQVQEHLGIVSSLSEHVDVRASRLVNIVPVGEGAHWESRVMGTNMAFRREALLGVGGFDEFYIYISEETDVAMRLAQAGKTTLPVLEAAVYHVPASSRNRVVFTHLGRFWRLATRAQVYFSIKNGPIAGDSGGTILIRCLHLMHGHWLLFNQLRRQGHFTWWQQVQRGIGEVYGGLEGAAGGLLHSRRLIEPTQLEAMSESTDPVLQFQNTASASQPAIDPVSGHQPAISLSEPPLRICLLSSTYPPTQYDGVGRLTNLMARGLFELGHQVHVITGGDSDRMAFFDGAYVHYMPYELKRYEQYKLFTDLFHTLNRSHAVYETVKRLKFNDAIQIVDSPLWLYEGLVTALSGILPVVVRLVTAHLQVSALHQEHQEDDRLVGEMERSLIERAAHVLPNTQATLDAVQKVYGLHLSPDRYTIVPYGLEPAPDEAIRPFNPDQGRDNLTILFVGRLEKRKGIQDLFKAIPLILKEAPQIRFVIAGADNSYWDGFQRQTGMDYPTYFARQYPHLVSRVQFTGSVSDDVLQNLYQSCDLFVAPSLYESFGLIYLEAMNYAKPVIGCRAGGIPEVIEEGVNGLLADPGAYNSLAWTIITMLKSPERLREMGLAGRRKILSKFNYLEMARAFQQVYRAVARP